MRYLELEGDARYTARDDAYDAWAQTAGYRREVDEWRDSCMESFLSDTGLDGFADVVGFEAGEPKRAMRDADAVLSLDYKLGPAWGDGERLGALLRHLAANATTSAWLAASGIPRTVEEDGSDGYFGLSSTLMDLLMDVCDKAPFPYFNATMFEMAAYSRLVEMLEDGTLDYEFAEDGGLVG